MGQSCGYSCYGDVDRTSKNGMITFEVGERMIGERKSIRDLGGDDDYQASFRNKNSGDIDRETKQRIAISLG